MILNSNQIHRIRHQDLKHGIEKRALIELLDFIGNRPLVSYHPL